MIINHIDLSDGQIEILRKVSKIYIKNLTIVYNQFRGNTGRLKELTEMIESAGFTPDSIIKALEDDFINMSDIPNNPDIILGFKLQDIYIIQFIIHQWAKEEDWNDMEVAGLLNKLSIIRELITNSEKPYLS